MQEHALERGAQRRSLLPPNERTKQVTVTKQPGTLASSGPPKPSGGGEPPPPLARGGALPATPANHGACNCTWSDYLASCASGKEAAGGCGQICCEQRATPAGHAVPVFVISNKERFAVRRPLLDRMGGAISSVRSPPVPATRPRLEPPPRRSPASSLLR